MARGSIQMSKLTKGDKTADPQLPPTDTSRETSDSFDFPTLNTDGSVSDLIDTRPPPGQRTPPAALSSLGVRMAATGQTDAAPVTELNDDQYDMADDVSDYDGNETVSMASDNLDQELSMTPEESEDGMYEPDQSLLSEYHPLAEGPTGGEFMIDEEAEQELRRAAQRLKRVSKKERDIEKEKQMESFLSEDLETPRQSTMNAFKPLSSVNGLGDPTSITKASTTTYPSKLPSPSDHDAPTHVTSKNFVEPSLVPAARLLALVAFIVGVMIACSSSQIITPTSTAARREALSDSLVRLTNSTNATKSFNIDHLVPHPTALNSTNIFGQPESGTLDVHFQGVLPNYIVVSLPRTSSDFLYGGPQAVSTAVYKADKPVAFSQAKLVDGIYAITLDPEDVYGIVTVAMLCKNPKMNVTVSHNFGRRFLQLPTFEKARTDISNTVTKDVAVARARVLGITDRFTAGLVATHNVSSQLAQQVTHEAQVIASTAASLAGKVYSAGDATAATVRKDIIAVQEGFALAETQVDDFVADVAGRIKRSVMEPLAVAQDRAGRIRAKYFGSETAREKVCRRDVAVKNDASNLFAPASRFSGYKTTKDGLLVGKKTCGSCDSSKKNLGPRGLYKTHNKDQVKQSR